MRLYPVKTDGTTFIEWFGEFDANADAENRLRQPFIGIYDGFFEDLRKAV